MLKLYQFSFLDLANCCQLGLIFYLDKSRLVWDETSCFYRKYNLKFLHFIYRQYLNMLLGVCNACAILSGQP